MTRNHQPYLLSSISLPIEWTPYISLHLGSRGIERFIFIFVGVTEYLFILSVEYSLFNEPSKIHQGYSSPLELIH